MFGVRARMKASGTAHLLATRGIAWFVALACIGLIGLEASRIIDRRSEVIADARKDTSNLTSSLIQHAELIFRSADAVLTGIAERLEHDGLDPPARDRLRTWLTRQVSRSPQFVSLSIVDSKGIVTLTTNRDAVTRSVTDREYFIFLRDHNEDALHIASPVRGLSSGEWVIPVTRRFNRPDGSFGGIAVASINPQYFQNIYDRLDIGSISAVLLATTNGTLLVRRPFIEANVGRDMSQAKIMAALKQAPSGSLEITATPDGVARFNSYQQGHAYPIFVAVAQNMDELLAPWRANSIRRMIEAAAIAAFILLMGAFVWRATKV